MRVFVSVSTRSSAIAEGPRDASCQLKSCQLPRNSAETTCATSPKEIEVMKLEGYSGTMCNKHVHSTMTRSSRFHCPIGVMNKPTTSVCLYYFIFMCRLSLWPLVVWYKINVWCLKMNDWFIIFCVTFYQVLTIWFAGGLKGLAAAVAKNISGCKILKCVTWPWPYHFQGWLVVNRLDLLPLTYRPNLKFLTSAITKIWKAVQNAQIGAARSHSRSSAISPFDSEHMTSYSTLIESRRISSISCTVFEI